MNPFKLPLEEQQLIVSTMLEIITKQGFSTGIFHCEARIRNSQMAYEYPSSSASSSSSSQAWLPDLQQVILPAQHTATRDRNAASVFLHEINPRLPGSVSCIRTLLGHGVDYWCLSILFALQDWQRFALMSQPFRKPAGHCINVTVNAHLHRDMIRNMFPDVSDEELHRQYIPPSHDPMPDLVRMYPNVMNHVRCHFPVVIFYDRFGKDSDAIVWDACLVIFSEESRENALRLAETCDRLYKEYLLTTYPGLVWI